MDRSKKDQKAALGGLDDQIGFALRLAQVAVFKDFIAALKMFGLRPTDFSVLAVIAATPGLKQQEVGELLHIQRPNLVIILDQLQARGLIMRGNAPRDRRSYALSLTAEGEALLEGAKIAQGLHENRVDALLEGFDKTMIIAALKRISTL